MSRATKPILKVPSQSLSLQAKLFRGFADHSRLSILSALRAGPLPVNEIVARTGLTQPNVSNHLRCLSECGLVLSEQDGRFVLYRLGDPRINRILSLAKELLDKSAQGIDSCKNYDS